MLLPPSIAPFRANPTDVGSPSIPATTLGPDRLPDLWALQPLMRQRIIVGGFRYYSLIDGWLALLVLRVPPVRHLLSLRTSADWYIGDAISGRGLRGSRVRFDTHAFGVHPFPPISNLKTYDEYARIQPLAHRSGCCFRVDYLATTTSHNHIARKCGMAASAGTTSTFRFPWPLVYA